MIISKLVDVKIGSKNKKHYEDLGYISNYGDIITVNIKDVPKFSQVRISAKCFVCEEIKTPKYCSYSLSIEKGGFYYCSQKCSNIKVRMTNLERYGEEVPSKSKEVYNKMIQTNLDRYGVENPGEYKEFKDKIKITNLDRYGVESVFKNENIKNKIKETTIFKYGVDNISKSDDIKRKKEKTMKDRYGVSCILSLPNIRDKAQKSNMKVPIKSYNNTNLKYQGSYELDFLNNYNYLNIENGKTIKFYLNDKEHIYFSDFYLPDYNLIIEIKSEYTYNFDLEKNIEKQKYSIINGFNHIFIIDKNYTELENIIKKDSLN